MWVDKHVRGQHQSRGIATDNLPRSSRARAFDMKTMTVQLLLVDDRADGHSNLQSSLKRSIQREFLGPC